MTGLTAPGAVGKSQETWTRFEAVSLMVPTMQLVHGLNPSVRHAVNRQRETREQASVNPLPWYKEGVVEKQIICADLLIYFI